MSNFSDAIKIVLLHEKGYINDPNDPGGATNYGISLRWLKSINEINEHAHLIGDIHNDEVIDIDDIKKMKEPEAVKLYKTYWWDKYKYENIYSQIIATKVMDLSVNMGSIQAHKNLQRAVRAVTGQMVLDDGILGQMSFKAVNDCNADLLICAYRSETAGFYRRLNKPNYIKGWLNRAYD